jgi:hypothetical protein
MPYHRNFLLVSEKGFLIILLPRFLFLMEELTLKI